MGRSWRPATSRATRTRPPRFSDQPPRIAPTESRHQSATLVGGVLAGLRGPEPGGSGGRCRRYLCHRRCREVWAEVQPHIRLRCQCACGPADGVASAHRPWCDRPSARAQAYQAALMSSVFVGTQSVVWLLAARRRRPAPGECRNCGRWRAGLVSPHGDDTQPGRLSAPLLPTAMPEPCRDSLGGAHRRCR